MTFPKFQLQVQTGANWGKEGKQIREEQKKSKSAAWGQGSDFPSRDIHDNTFELFSGYRNTYQIGEVNCVLPKVAMLTPTYLTTNHQKSLS